MRQPTFRSFVVVAVLATSGCSFQLDDINGSPDAGSHGSPAQGNVPDASNADALAADASTPDGSDATTESDSDVDAAADTETAKAEVSSDACHCAECSGKSGKCKTWSPAGCGDMNTFATECP